MPLLKMALYKKPALLASASAFGTSALVHRSTAVIYLIAQILIVQRHRATVIPEVT